jgi:putative transposase
VINRKRTYRLYKAENLTVRRGRRYVRPSANACGSSFPGGATSAGRWTSQLMRCGLASAFDACASLMTPLGRARHSCPIFPSAASGPCALLDELACRHGPPAEIVMDNGPEFSGRAHFAWSARTGVRLRFVQPGKPIPNAFVESFIGRFRDECLNQQHWFASLAEAARLIEAWRQHYNRERRHSALGYEPPERFARRLGALGLDQGSRPLARAPAPAPCYDLNGSPSPRT